MHPPDRISRRKRARQIVAARLERLEDLSIGKLVPSSLTLLGLGSGITAIRFAVDSKWAVAVTFVIAAMILAPILVERPIVVSAKGAALCRPADLVLTLI